MKLLKAVFATSIFALTNSANADTYYFQQVGFSGGAYVLGSFSGSDLNGDGLLSGTEVTDFNMRFSGGDGVPGFVIVEASYYDVTYDFDGTIDTDNEILRAIGVSGVSAFITDDSNYYDFTYNSDGTIDTDNDVLKDSDGTFSYVAANGGFRSDPEVWGEVTVDSYNFNNTASYATVTTFPASVPEPSTYALMLGGLGLVGFTASRRRKQV